MKWAHRGEQQPAAAPQEAQHSSAFSCSAGRDQADGKLLWPPSYFIDPVPSGKSVGFDKT